jgi:hypothetical protein
MRAIYETRTPMPELVARFNRTADALWRRAERLDLHRPKRRGMKPGYIRWTPEQDAVLLEHYPAGMPIAELMERTDGHPKDSIYNRARELGLQRAPGSRQHGSTLGRNQLAILCLAARPEGVSAPEMGMRTNAAGQACKALRERGLLFRAALGVKTVRWFTTERAAERYLAANLAAHQAKQRRPTLSIKSRPGWERDAPPIFTPATKYTFAPPPPAMVFRTNTHSPL